jgi:glycosyltransferase involved in cell wall biosynthesis
VRTLIVHEWLTNNAGSERVVAELRRIFPGAQVATTMRWGVDFEDWDVITTPLQRFANGPAAHVKCLPLMPAAWQATKLPAVDRVVTSFHTFGLWARVPDRAEHIVYCHTPPRFLWAQDQIRARGSRALDLSTRAVGGVLRYLDRRRAMGRPVRWLANSQFTADRLRFAYGVDAEVVYPPVATGVYENAARTTPKGDHYLVLGRVVPYKRVDLAIEAFRDLKTPLVGAGSGRQAEELKRLAPANVHFIGSVAEADKPALLAGARGLVFPGEEDFGIVPIEAMAAGTPVIGYRRGGLAETVRDGIDGVLFADQTAAAVRDAVERSQDLELRPTTPPLWRDASLAGLA